MILITDSPGIASVLTPEANFHDKQKEVKAENKYLDHTLKSIIWFL